MGYPYCEYVSAPQETFAWVDLAGVVVSWATPGKAAVVEAVDVRVGCAAVIVVKSLGLKSWGVATELAATKYPVTAVAVVTVVAAAATVVSTIAVAAAVVGSVVGLVSAEAMLAVGTAVPGS